MDKKNIIVASIWFMLFFVTIITQTAQLVLSLLFTLFVLTFYEEIISKFIKNKMFQKTISSIMSVITIILIITSFYYAITYMAKDLIILAKDSQNEIIKNLSFLGINNISELYEKFITYINENLIIVAGSAFVVLKVLIGSILGFVFYFSKLEYRHKVENLEEAVINDLIKYGNKIFISFKNIIEIQVIVAILNTIIISILSFAFYLSGETLPFWYIIIPLTTIISLIPVVGNLLINFMLILCTLQISLIYVLIGVGSFLVAHKLELIVIGQKIKDKINISFILVLLSMLLGELLFHSMSGMLLGMVIMLSLSLIAREIEYKDKSNIKLLENFMK